MSRALSDSKNDSDFRRLTVVDRNGNKLSERSPLDFSKTSCIISNLRVKYISKILPVHEVKPEVNRKSFFFAEISDKDLDFKFFYTASLLLMVCKT